MKFGSITNKGMKRKDNEDCLFATDKKIKHFENIFIVADGVGGNVGGKKASRLAVKNFLKSIKSNDLINMMKDARYKTLFQIALSKTSKAILEYGNIYKNFKGLCSTFLGCTIKDGKAYACNVGDSRLYLLSQKEEKCEGKIVRKRAMVQITQDNSEIIETKIIPDRVIDELNRKYDTGIFNNELTTKKRYLTKVVGMYEDVLIDYYEIDLTTKLQEGKTLKLLLCSDGLYDALSDNEIMDIVFLEHLKINQRLKKLVKEANLKGGRDNISIILIEI